MQRITKVFQSGNSQAVRLPKEFRIETTEVFVRKEGNAIIITPRPDTWQGFLADSGPLSKDFSVQGTILPKDCARDPL